MASTTSGAPPSPGVPDRQVGSTPGPGRHRAERRRRTSRRWPALLLALVLVAGAALVVLRVVRDSHDGGDNPVIALPQAPSTESMSVVHGILTLTDDCLSVPDGLLVWPVGTTWDADQQTVDVVYDKAQATVGEEFAMRGSLVASIPTQASSTIPADLLARLRACARTTGITSVAVVT